MDSATWKVTTQCWFNWAYLCKLLPYIKIDYRKYIFFYLVFPFIPFFYFASITPVLGVAIAFLF